MLQLPEFGRNDSYEVSVEEDTESDREVDEEEEEEVSSDSETSKYCQETVSSNESSAS